MKRVILIARLHCILQCAEPGTEQNDILAEEQNSSKSYCTLRLTNTHTTIINTKKISPKFTFSGFVDFFNACDKINGNLLA